MTEQEAIGYLKTLPNRIPLKFFTDDGAKVYDEFSQVVTSALEKHIPKKPTEEQIDFEEFVCICPTCKYTCEYGFEDFRDRKYEYCPMCCQKLDWSEEE